MNTIYKLYFILPNFARVGFIGKVINKLLAMALKRLFDFFVPSYFLKTEDSVGYGLNTNYRSEKYIVSLTSFPARINDVWITIECILRQTFKPDAIILWLAESQFPEKTLPENLVRLKERGLTIQFCDEDIRSHKKYLYALEQFPNDFIITLDDDLYYDEDLLLNLVNLKKRFPDSIATNRAHAIKIDKNNKLLPYRKWVHNFSELKEGHDLVQTGGFGTIYVKSDLFNDFSNKHLLRELAFHADDIWLKIMVFLNNKKVVTNFKYNKDPITVKSSQIEKLVTTNVLAGGNDTQLSKLINYYRINPKDFFKR